VVGLVVGRSQLSSGSSGELLATTCTAFVAVFLLTLFVVGGFWFRFSSASYSFAVLADVCVGCLFWLLDRSEKGLLLLLLDDLAATTVVCFFVRVYRGCL
jgi:hypothetical protein